MATNSNSKVTPAEMQDFASEYGVPDPGFQNEEKARTYVVELVNTVRSIFAKIKSVRSDKSSSKSAVSIKAALNFLRDTDHVALSRSASLDNEIRAMVHAALLDCPEIAFYLFDDLAEIKSAVNDHRTLALSKLGLVQEVDEDDDDDENDVDVAALVRHARVASSLLDAAPMILGMAGLEIADLSNETDDHGKAIIKSVDLMSGPKGQREKVGEDIKLDLPKIQGPRNTDGTKAGGRKVQTAGWSFNLNGQDLPRNLTTLEYGVRYLTEGGSYYNGKDLETALFARTGWTFQTAPEGTEVVLPVPAGELVLVRN